MKTNVLVLCTGNACRSQMAEGWLRALRSDVCDVKSAGIEAHGVNATAVDMMAEVGIDIRHEMTCIAVEFAVPHSTSSLTCEYCRNTSSRNDARYVLCRFTFSTNRIL